MDEVDLRKARELVLRDTRRPHYARWLERADVIALALGIGTVLLRHSVRQTVAQPQPWEFSVIVVAAMGGLSGSLAARFRWSLARRSFLRRHRWAVGVSAIWLASVVAVIILGPVLPEWTSRPVSRWQGFVFVSEIALLARGLGELLSGLRGAAAGTVNPAVLLVVSFAGLIAVGTVLLMFPRARARPPAAPIEGAPFVTALFTATSAACVTGLVVEHTGTYWSRDGQIVILGLFQIGGLGIMTFGAFFGLMAGRNIALREHATLGDLLESEGLGNVRRLLLAILSFTLSLELLGAIALSSLWSDQPVVERAFQSLFHSVSAFCNAGFSLTDDSFVGQGRRWQVWGVLACLIIVGGLGFAVLSDLAQFAIHRLRRVRQQVILARPRHGRRLTLTTLIVVVTSLSLLVSGTVGIFLLERAATAHIHNPPSLADAWFQSVTCRTAGFNTVDIGEWHPATKLLAILLMFIGASPGSTGGGIKTVAFALAVLGLFSVLRGRQHIECSGRTLPDSLVFRALTVMFLSLMLIMAATMLLVLYEDCPAHFLDYLFEAASAVGTVGLSSSIALENGSVTSVTQSLSTPSRLVIIAAMFLGRVGPLTLLIAIAGRTTSARYQYPEERVMLG